jgi:hypothetical protein
MAHTCACRRIAEAISGTGARLATGSGGLTLGRAGFAPAGRQTKFHEGIFSSFPFDQPCLVALNFLSVLPLDTSSSGMQARVVTQWQSHSLDTAKALGDLSVWHRRYHKEQVWRKR